MKRSELRRSSSLTRSWLPRSQTGMRGGPVKPKRSVGARKQDGLRRPAYSVVDERSGGRCEFPLYVNGPIFGRCGGWNGQHHHRRPRRSGGSTDPTTETAGNLLLLCEYHHAKVESNRDDAYRNGWLIRAGHDPASTPVLLHLGWCLLDDEGHYLPYERENR